MLEDLFSEMDLCILNDGSSTYIHPATGSTSTLDLSICGHSLVLDYEWNIHEDLYGSDHFPMILTSNAVEEPRIPSESQKGIASAREGLHSLIQLSGIWASLSESVAVSSSHPRFLDLFCGCHVMFRLVRHVLYPPTTETNKGMHTSGTPASVHQGSKRNILRWFKKRVYFYPLIYPKPLPSNQIRAKHDLQIDWVGPTQPSV